MNPSNGQVARPEGNHEEGKWGGGDGEILAGSPALPLSPSTPPAGPIRLGTLEIARRYWLSPLAGYTNLAFRLAVRELGGLGMATTDLVNARALLQGGRKSMELVQSCPADRPLAVQIYGAEPGEMIAAAQWLESSGVSAVDINMGCPVHKVVRGGGGSAMMCDAHRAVGLVRVVVEAVSIPVTVKMRLGWDEANLTAPLLAREFEQVGAAAVIIHGRTRAQGFAGAVNLAGIRSVVEAVTRIPVVGNGDVLTIEDAIRMRTLTGCAAVSIGRGALLNPWIFAQLERWETSGDPGPSPTYRDRLYFMSRHFRLLTDLRGERLGCLQFRKVANWYCKVLRPGRVIQQQMVRIERIADFQDILEQLQAIGRDCEDNRFGEETEPLIPVPSGPIERW
jgi:nifR3 family TIM-barrel protein